MPSSGAGLARMAIDATVVRVEIICTSSENTSPSGVRTSTGNVLCSAIADLACLGARLALGARFGLGLGRAFGLALGGRVGLALGLGLLLVAGLRLPAGLSHDLVDRALHKEGPLGD